MIMEFSMEFRPDRGSTELPILAWKIVEKPTFHGIGEVFHFLSTEFPFPSAEFPFSDRRILGGLFRAVLGYKICIF